MEIMIFIGLLLVAATNIYTASKLKMTVTNLINPEIKIEVPAPIVNVNVPDPVVIRQQPRSVNLDIDYDRLEELVGRLIETRPVIIPNVSPTTPTPMWWQSPAISSDTVNTNVYEDGHQLYNSVEIDGHTVKEFPR